MWYKVFNGAPILFRVGMPVPKLDYYGDVVVAIDPSKTNMAVVVGDPTGEVLSIVEISGNKWHAQKEDTTQYCIEFTDFLTRFLEGVRVYRFGIEKAITKKGMTFHASTMVLTEIRAALLAMVYKNYNLFEEDVGVNNWSWKSAILPDGYRSMSEKGSVRYFREYLGDHTYDAYFEDDVTDCLCIYKYLIQSLEYKYMIVCQEVESVRREFKALLMPKMADSLKYREFMYNRSFSMKENAIYFANRSKKSGIAVCKVEWLRLQDIYRYAMGFLAKDIHVEECRLVVQV